MLPCVLACAAKFLLPGYANDSSLVTNWPPLSAPQDYETRVSFSPIDKQRTHAHATSFKHQIVPYYYYYYHYHHHPCAIAPPCSLVDFETNESN